MSIHHMKHFALWENVDSNTAENSVNHTKNRKIPIQTPKIPSVIKK